MMLELNFREWSVRITHLGPYPAQHAILIAIASAVAMEMKDSFEFWLL